MQRSTADLGYAAHFDHLFYSCELGAAKPDGAFFAAVLNRLGMPGEQVLFIDDHASNVAAARQAGLWAEVYEMQAGASAMRTLLSQYGLWEA